jgi:uncharacterized protein (UPF0335 family)
VSGKMNRIDGRKLLGFVERYERLEAERDDLKNDQKVVIAEAETEGFSSKGIKFCAKVRAKTPREHEEDEALRDLYLHGIGMADTPPLFRQLDAMVGQPLGRDELIDRFKELVPTSGEIVLKLEGGTPLRLWRDKDGKPHSEEVKPPRPAGSAPQRPAAGGRPPVAEVPDVDDAGAEALGREFARDNRPIIANPFPFGDARRPRFDVGWRKETGNDGMGEDE